MKRQFFHQEGLILDFSKVFINPLAQKVHFVYVPIQGYNSGYVFREFLLNIIQYGSFAQWEDSSYVREYIGILNKGIHFSEFELEEYIKALSGKGQKERELVECRFCHAMVEKTCNFCTECGSKIDIKKVGNTGRCISKGDIYDPTDGFKEGTTVLGADYDDFDEEGTTLLSPQDLYQSYSRGYLIRVKTNERIEITKDSFVIGKGKTDTDYTVTENSAVSRKHIRISRKEEQFYLEDLHSTNKTFVGESIVEPEKEVEIYDGTKIRLGNEEFIFEIETVE